LQDLRQSQANDVKNIMRADYDSQEDANNEDE
jgi:hypothetical protein